MGVTVKLEGIGEVYKAFENLALEIGDKKATSKVLVPAVRQAMKPVLSRAQSNAPADTNALKLSLIVEARRPTKRDRRSKYITDTDTVIASVTTASGKKLAAMSEGRGLIQTRKRLIKMGATAEQAKAFMGFKSDARAMSQEFGSSRNPAHPYLRPALESMAQETINNLGHILGKKIDEFKR
jgi:HK97 gp10 family phage protein